jgi:hypothetical protein
MFAGHVSYKSIRGTNLFCKLFHRQQDFTYPLHGNNVNESLVCYKQLAAFVSPGRFPTLLSRKEGIHIEIISDPFVSEHPVVGPLVLDSSGIVVLCRRCVALSIVRRHPIYILVMLRRKDRIMCIVYDTTMVSMLAIYWTIARSNTTVSMDDYWLRRLYNSYHRRWRFRLKVRSILVCCGGLHTQQEFPGSGNSVTRYQKTTRREEKRYVD